MKEKYALIRNNTELVKLTVNPPHKDGIDHPSCQHAPEGMPEKAGLARDLEWLHVEYTGRPEYDAETQGIRLGKGTRSGDVWLRSWTLYDLSIDEIRSNARHAAQQEADDGFQYNGKHYTFDEASKYNAVMIAVLLQLPVPATIDVEAIDGTVTTLTGEADYKAFWTAGFTRGADISKRKNDKIKGAG